MAAWAEYMLAPARNLIAKPQNLTHVEVAGLARRLQDSLAHADHNCATAGGETVFIPGAGGGVASMGIQIAKYAGAPSLPAPPLARRWAKRVSWAPTRS